MGFIPPGSSAEEAVKARVDKQVRIRSYEVITENGTQYRCNRQHLRKSQEGYETIKSRSPHEDPTPALPETPPPIEPAVLLPNKPSPGTTG